MAEAPIQRVSPLTVYEWQRPLALSTGPGITRPDGTVVRLGAQELVTTSDEGRVWRGDGTYLGGTVDHGPVANATAMSVIWLQPSCTRGVHPGDTCWRSDLGVEYRVISGHNATAVWRAVGAGNAAVAGAQPLNATLTSIAGQGASTWGLARLLDSGAPAAKGALGIQRADIGDSSAAGRALMAVSTPSEASVPVISSAGTVATTPLSSLGGGGSWTPAALRNLIEWHDATSGVLDSSGNACTNGTLVASWSDLSSAGRTLSQATSTYRPTFVAAVIAGLPALDMGSTGSLYRTLSLLAEGFDREFTIYIVRARKASGDSFGQLVWTATANTGTNYINCHGPYSNGTTYFDAGNAGDYRISSANMPFRTHSRWHSIALLRGRSYSRIAVDGVIELSSSVGTSEWNSFVASTTEMMYFGNIATHDAPANAYFGAIVVASRALSIGELGQLDSYYAAKGYLSR